MLRVRIVGLFFALLFFGVITRLFYWQIYKGKQLSVFARSQHQTGKSVDAFRGEIFSSDGSWLVASGEAWTLNASIPEIKVSKKEVSEKLVKILVKDKDLDENEKKIKIDAEYKRLLSLLERENAVWVILKNKIGPAEKEEIEGLKLSGISFIPAERREYPEASAGAQLLGFVGKDSQGTDRGYFGLEGYYDVVLSGKTGYSASEKDALGSPIEFGEGAEIKAIGGTGIITNIDKSIQLSLDKKLLEGITKYEAISGTAIVMDPGTGAILGMSSFPSYDPVKYQDYGDSLFQNPAVSASFEPGSVFKIIVMASALDAGVITPDTKCDICNKAAQIDGYSIETWDGKFHPDSKMTDVIVNSDNVGMVFVSQKLGVDKMYNYLTSFGIGEKTGIDLQGESSPAIRKKSDWKGIDLATSSFGQGIAVTPIQMLRAASVIANKGQIVTPMIARKLVGENWEEEIKPSKIRQVISEKASGEITAMMVEAASRGEAKWTYLKGYKVAGKTGTAQIPIAGHYDEKKTVASFIGFAPFDNPKFIMLVTLNQPQTSQWASETAAPLWYQIAKDLFIRFGIQPD